MDINSMSFDQLVPSKSKYLTKDDVGEDGMILTIQGFKTEKLETDEGTEEKIVLHFLEDMKPMVLNRTNAQLLAKATGANNAGEARGKKIVVYNDPMVSFGSKVTGGLRIKKASSGEPKAAPSKAAEAKAELNDEIPF